MTTQIDAKQIKNLQTGGPATPQDQAPGTTTTIAAGTQMLFHMDIINEGYIYNNGFLVEV